MIRQTIRLLKYADTRTDSHTILSAKGMYQYPRGIKDLVKQLKYKLWSREK